MPGNTYAFTGGTFDGQTITDVQSVSINENGTPTDLSTDASRAVNLVIVDGKSVDITVTSTNNNLAANSAFRIGNDGQLVLNGKLRTAGDGLSVTAMTITIPKCVLVDSSNDVNHAGESTVSFTFRAYNDAVDHSDAVSGLIVYS